MGVLDGKRVLVTGGTGSLGRVLVSRLLTGEVGQPAAVIVFSRDEAKQHAMRLSFQHRTVATDEAVFEPGPLQFRIGDVCDRRSIGAALAESDVVFHAAALKQVPTCEYAPFEAVRTNIIGAENLVSAIREQALPIETVIGVTTDKACRPVNVMGMTKALQERILAKANLNPGPTRFLTARYGNVLASRGSVVPLFHEQIKRGGPVTVTAKEMTRFLLSIDDAVDTIFAALEGGLPGETYVPRVPSVRIIDLATALIGELGTEIRITGIRPGEKVHEALVSEEESLRTKIRGNYLAVGSILPELHADSKVDEAHMEFGEYSSEQVTLDVDGVRDLLARNSLALSDEPEFHL